MARRLEELRNNNVSLQQHVEFSRIVREVNLEVTNNFSVSRFEPTRVLGDISGEGEDFVRLLSFLRERDGEVELLRSKIIDMEKKSVTSEYSNVPS